MLRPFYPALVLCLIGTACYPGEAGVMPVVGFSWRVVCGCWLCRSGLSSCLCPRGPDPACAVGPTGSPVFRGPPPGPRPLPKAQGAIAVIGPVMDPRL